MKKNNQGFTLIQLLVVLGVMGVLVVLSLSVGRSLTQKSALTGAVNQFIADFNYAKQLASLENRYVAVIFDSTGRSYSIRTQDTIGDLTNWTIIRNVEPMDGHECFNGGTMQNFAVNSVGEVFQYPITGSVPTSLNFSFYVKYEARGVIDYQRNINIYPSGGIRVEKQ